MTQKLATGCTVSLASKCATAGYMRSDTTCATLREYVSWATATADLEFGSRLSLESDLSTRSNNYAYRQVVLRNCNLSMLHKSSSGYDPEDMDIVWHTQLA